MSKSDEQQTRPPPPGAEDVYSAQTVQTEANTDIRELLRIARGEDAAPPLRVPTAPRVPAPRPNAGVTPVGARPVAPQVPPPPIAPLAHPAAVPPPPPASARAPVPVAPFPAPAPAPTAPAPAPVEGTAPPPPARAQGLHAPAPRTEPVSPAPAPFRALGIAPVHARSMVDPDPPPSTRRVGRVLALVLVVLAALVVGAYLLFFASR